MVAVRAVIFDLDDTLVHTAGADAVAHDAAARLASQRMPNLDVDKLEQSFIALFQKSPWDPEHKVGVEEWRSALWAKALAEQGIVDSLFAKDLQEQFNRARLDMFVWNEGVEQMIRDLQSDGYKLGIITNGHKETQRAKLAACKAYDLFPTIIVGGEEPHEKPHMSIFEKALGLMGCEPQETIMVGDNLYTDILGGNTAKLIGTVWINPQGKEAPEGAPRPTYTIPAVRLLIDVLKEMNMVK